MKINFILMKNLLIFLDFPDFKIKYLVYKLLSEENKINIK